MIKIRLRKPNPLYRCVGEFINLATAAAAMAALQSLSTICKPTAASRGSTQCCACQPQQKLEGVARCRLKFGSLSSSCSSSSSCASYYNYVGRLGSRTGRSLACRAAAQEPDDRSSSSTGEGGGFEVDKALEDVLRNDDSKRMLESLAEKALQDDEESRVLLKDFAAAAERVAKAKEELESIDRRESELAEIVSQMISKAVDEETNAASLVTDRERAVRAAEEELRAAEIALVTARAGGSVGKWENEDIDEDLERVESGKAAAISGIAGTLASVPFLLTGDELGIGSLLSIGGVVISCGLFGVTYRYILRRDLGNIQLKIGAAAAFALVRGIGQVDAIQLLVGYPAQGGEEVLLGTLSALEGLFSFGFSALALDYCLTNALLSPFPSKKC